MPRILVSEELAESGLARIYLATATASDDEMSDRIAHHRAIMKPFGPGELLATIREVLDGNDAQRANG